MADTKAPTAEQGGMKKTLSLWNFFTIGFGAIVVVPIGAVFGELTAAIPVSGGIVEYVDRTFGHTASYITGWYPALSSCAPSSSTPSSARTCTCSRRSSRSPLPAT